MSSGEVVLLDADGKSVALPATLGLSASGLALSLKLPSARKLQRAKMVLAAPAGMRDPLKPTPDHDAVSAAHWLSINLDVERAATGLTITVPALKVTAPKVYDPTKPCGARVRMLSAGNWLPLPARDTLTFAADGVASARFPACAASQLMLDLLVGSNGVLIPGAVDVTGVSVEVTHTQQPCHVSVAVGDDPPFFTVVGPLPTNAVPVDGLLRALNRYLVDHPGEQSVPLTLRAAASANVQLTELIVQQEPEPAAPGKAPPAPPPPRVEQAGFEPPQPTGGAPAAAPRQGRWCDADHIVAQGFEPGQGMATALGLSAVEIRARRLDTGAACSGVLALHLADASGYPASQPLQRWPWTPAPMPGDPDWLRLECPLPLTALPTGRWWLVLQVNEGELLWYSDRPADPPPVAVPSPVPAPKPPPIVASRAAWQGRIGPWMPVAPTGTDLLLTRLRLMPLGSPGT